MYSAFSHEDIFDTQSSFDAFASTSNFSARYSQAPTLHKAFETPSIFSGSSHHAGVPSEIIDNDVEIYD